MKDRLDGRTASLLFAGGLAAAACGGTSQAESNPEAYAYRNQDYRVFLHSPDSVYYWIACYTDDIPEVTGSNRTYTLKAKNITCEGDGDALKYEGIRPGVEHETLIFSSEMQVTVTSQ